MAGIKTTIKRTVSASRNDVKGRPTSNTPKAGYTSDGRRYGCGGKMRRKKS